MSTKVVEIKTLKVGKYIVLGGEACKIISYTTSSPGKHGAAKARIEAVGVFDNQKRSLVKPVDNKVDIPIIDKRLGQVISIQGDNVQIMDMENYDTIDLPMPEDLKDAIVEMIIIWLSGLYCLRITSCEICCSQAGFSDDTKIIFPLGNVFTTSSAH